MPRTTARPPASPSAASAIEADDRRLYEELVRDYSRPVFDYLWHMTGDRALAEDLAQDVFESALVHIGGLLYPDRARSWLFAIAANRLRDHWRRKRLIRWLPIESVHAAPNDQRGLSADTIDVQTALDQLKAEDRAVLVLCGIGGFTVAEAAESLGITKEALAKRWQRASRRFNEAMEGRRR